MEIDDGKFCPVCKFKNKPDAVVCEYCHSPLETNDEQPTTKRVAKSTVILPEGKEKFVEKVAQSPSKKGIAFYTPYSAEPIKVIEEADEIILGRKSEEGSNENILDLSSFGAFGMGVSRRHAKIKIDKNGAELIDLDSTNGTWINEQRLVPNHPTPLKSGVQVRMGRMILFIVINK